ncbi:MAG: serine protein kinase [Proteobacteria bacterium]|nr:MAG: serine protein kinase [Pseudomonadota bacterium]
MGDLNLLRDIERELADEFAAKRHVLSFDEFFEIFAAAPARFTRSAPQYIRDCFLHYGSYEVEGPGGTATRYRLFDCPWDGGQRGVVGQEQAQGALFGALSSFVREQRVTRMILLHGPNGSAKTSLVDCVAQAMEDYSTLDEGAIYRFSWVFPSASVAKKRLGFGASRPVGALDSYAHLPAEDVDARLPADLRDHPLLLVPPQRRRALLEGLRQSGALRGEEPLARYLLEGDLSSRSRAIYDALLSAYHGDHQRVLQHIQVERFYFSRRYRNGIVTIEPQLHVDAGMRQVTMDQGLQSLPSSLRSLSMFEPFGDLVDANRGLVNFNDLLKKPIDAFKYLLATCEHGTVALPQAIVHLDVVFLASTNEVHLRAFKEHPDWASFKGRMDLVKMPYIRVYTSERCIYDDYIAASGLEAQVVPHATYVLALWAVLTRLRRPNPEAYPAKLRDAIEHLSPLDKAELYAGARTPRQLSNELAQELRAALPDLLDEGQTCDAYEGSFGASPRAMKQTLMNALQSKRLWGISPLGILAELSELIKRTSLYQYLKLPTDAGYHDYERFIDQVRDRYFDLVDNELRGAMGLVSEQQYEELFARYILNVSYLLKGEQLANPTTGRYEAPDQRLMERLEGVWGPAGDVADFRRELISRVGAWRVSNAGEAINYRTLFPKLIEALEQDYYSQQRAKVQRMCEHLITVLIADDIREDPTRQGLQAAEVARAREVLAALEADYGYPRPALREVLGQLLKARY